MYSVKLSRSHFPAQHDQDLIEITVGDLLRRAAQMAPDRLALREITLKGEVGRSWTYTQLLSDVEKLARTFVSRHTPGDRIAVWAPNIPEWVLVELAAAMSGLTLVTVNPSFQGRELAYVLQQSKSKALYLVECFRGNPMGDMARQLAKPLPIFDIQNPDVLFGNQPDSGPFPAVQPNDAAQIQYTSGTTGFPKGAVLSHRGLINNSRLHAKRWGFGEGDTLLAFMPLFHTGGCAVSVLGGIGQVASIVLCPAFDPHLMNRLIEQEKVSHFMGVPTMLVGMLESLKTEPRNVSSVRGIVSGGAMVAPELVRQVRAAYGVGLQIIYGQTETCPVLTMVYNEDSIEDTTQTVGQPLPQTEVAILDTKTREVLPLGRVGEICARGYMTMLGYNDNPEATAATIDAKGWLHTGDLGTMNERGYFAVTGRVKDMIIRGGENIFPAEIENAMLEHPAVAEVAVVGIPDAKWGEIAVCFMRPKGSQRPERAELVNFCRERLSPQKTPAHWIYVSSWPLTGSGKIQKFQLREQFAQGLHRPI